LVIRYRKEDETLENPTGDSPPLAAAPRHLRKRPFRNEIPDSLLVPGATLATLGPRRAIERKRQAKPVTSTQKTSDRRKRTVARLAVICVSLCIPALVLAIALLG
jgi:hypothetical protein